MSYFVAKLFDIRGFGTASGVINGAFWFGAALGPLAVGGLYVKYGTYDMALAILLGAPA